jgi:hypothetical protein
MLFDFGCYKYVAPDGAENKSQRDGLTRSRSFGSAGLRLRRIPFTVSQTAQVKSISPATAVRAGPAIRAGLATSAYPGKPFPQFINSEGACARPPIRHRPIQPRKLKPDSGLRIWRISRFTLRHQGSRLRDTAVKTPIRRGRISVRYFERGVGR